jgi:hypothetical protein
MSQGVPIPPLIPQSINAADAYIDLLEVDSIHVVNGGSIDVTNVVASGYVLGGTTTVPPGLVHGVSDGTMKTTAGVMTGVVSMAASTAVTVGTLGTSGSVVVKNTDNVSTLSLTAGASGAATAISTDVNANVTVSNGLVVTGKTLGFAPISFNTIATQAVPASVNSSFGVIQVTTATIGADSTVTLTVNVVAGPKAPTLANGPTNPSVIFLTQQNAGADASKLVLNVGTITAGAPGTGSFQITIRNCDPAVGYANSLDISYMIVTFG